MGTDIEFYVERREGNEWVSCDTWDRDPEGFLSGREFLASTCYSDRDYDVFSILAEVRSSGDYTSIASPRGLPRDMSQILTMRASESVGDGYGHSPSWLILAEILEFDWDQKITLEGYAHASHFHDWVCRGRRDDGYSPPDLFELAELEENRPDHMVVSENEIFRRTDSIENPYATKDVSQELRLREDVQRALGDCFCHVSWTATYRSRAENFFRYAVSEMKKHGPPEDVRCVFWFG